MLDWKSAWILEILQKADHAMTANELYEEVGETFGICAIVSALYDLEALNMVVPETDRAWKFWRVK